MFAITKIARRTKLGQFSRWQGIIVKAQHGQLRKPQAVCFLCMKMAGAQNTYDFGIVLAIRMIR